MMAPRLRVLEVRIYERPTVVRLPFYFGVIILRECQQAFARVRIDVEGHGDAWGMAAETLSPKWFDKIRALSNEENLDQLRKAVRIAADAYLAAGPLNSFGLFSACYVNQICEGAKAGLPPLAAGYGQALLDRAVLDAVCIAMRTNFVAAIQVNLPGITTALLPELEGFDIGRCLANLAPLAHVAARHTVGMIDPLTKYDQRAGECLNGGLPETLEELVKIYGTRHFKIKITGDIEEASDRLNRVASVLGRIDGPYIVSIDGNEQNDEEGAVLALLSCFDSLGNVAIRRLLASTVYIEQPINRGVSLDTPVHRIAARAALIIDESDGSLDVFPKHRPFGSTGVSSKTCKGCYRSILNAALCQIWMAESGGRKYFLTGEDLTLQAGIARQQDLALVSLLGIEHAERNGHHYALGMSAAPASEQRRFLTAFPDLYRDLNGVTCARIEDGLMSTGAIH